MKINLLGRVFFRRFLVLCVYVGITSVLVYPWGWLQLVYWVVGTFIAWWLLDFDQVLDAFWVNSEVDINQEGLRLLKIRDWESLWLWFVSTSGTRSRLILHSVVFEFFILLLGLYVATSGENLFAKGLVLGLLGRLVWEQAMYFFKNGDLDAWFWQLSVDMPKQVQGVVAAASLIVWIWLTVLAL